MRKTLLSILFINAILLNGFSQKYSELENYECTYLKEIVVPFNRSKSGEEIINPPLNQTISYTDTVQFSYWYKVIVKEDTIIGFKVEPIEKSDNYVMLVYQYNKNDFCDKLYYQKIQPLSLLNKKIKTDSYMTTQKTMRVKKDSVYYLSIINTSANNCGHFLRLWEGKDTLNIRALHEPCTKKALIVSKQPVSKNLFEIRVDSLKPGDSFVLKNIYFHPNTYALKEDPGGDLSKLGDYLIANQKVRIQIQGHTNGNNRIYKNSAYRHLGEEWNFSGSAKKLSKMRAETIKEYLVSKGVDKNRLVATGYGGDKTIIKNPSTDEEGQHNIRVEILILENGQEVVTSQVKR